MKINRNRKPSKHPKFEMQTTLIGRKELELLKKAKESLSNPEEICTCSEGKKRSRRWI